MVGKVGHGIKRTDPVLYMEVDLGRLFGGRMVWKGITTRRTLILLAHFVTQNLNLWG